MQADRPLLDRGADASPPAPAGPHGDEGGGGHDALERGSRLPTAEGGLGCLPPWGRGGPPARRHFAALADTSAIDWSAPSACTPGPGGRAPHRGEAPFAHPEGAGGIETDLQRSLEGTLLAWYLFSRRAAARAAAAWECPPWDDPHGPHPSESRAAERHPFDPGGHRGHGIRVGPWGGWRGLRASATYGRFSGRPMAEWSFWTWPRRRSGCLRPACAPMDRRWQRRPTISIVVRRRSSRTRPTSFDFPLIRRTELPSPRLPAFAP